jgi:hypothetical protein
MAVLMLSNWNMVLEREEIASNLRGRGHDTGTESSFFESPD